MSDDERTQDPVVEARDEAQEVEPTVNAPQRDTPRAASQASWSDIAEALRSDPSWSSGVVVDVFYWRDPIRSGLLFSIVALSWFLLVQAEFSPLTLGAYIYLGLIVISFALVQYANFSGKSHPLRSRIGQIGDIMSQEEFVQHAETGYRVADASSAVLRDALFFKDVALSLQMLGLVIVSAILFNFVSIPTVVFVASVILFSVPKIYELQHERIDPLLAKAKAAISEKLGPLLQKVPVDKLKLKQD